MVEAVTPLKVAVMVAVPAATPVAKPEELMVATAVLLEVQVAEVVTVAVLLSEYVAVAVNCCVPRLLIVELLGAMVNELTTLLLTVSGVLCVRPLVAALMVVLPRATAVAKPLALMVATAGFEEVQVTVEVMSCVVPLPRYPLAENCWVPVGKIEAFRGLMVNEATSFGPIKKLLQPTKIISSKRAVSR